MHMSSTLIEYVRRQKHHSYVCQIHRPNLHPIILLPMGDGNAAFRLASNLKTAWLGSTCQGYNPPVGIVRYVRYVRYVTQKYVKTTIIVFNGYKEEPTIKDATQLRWTGATPGVTVHFSGDMIIQSKKDQFLNNKEHKQRLLVYLSAELEKAGCITDHAKHDADVLIVQTAI